MLKQPVGVIQMTNVAIIRYRLNNKHFEIACYKNKAIDWRNGVEKDLSEVLQIDKIFTSASHGDEASKTDIKHYFPNMTKDQIMKVILEKGDLQLGDREREIQIEQNYKGIVKFIQEKCIHSVKKCPLNQQSIEHAIGKINFIVRQDHPVKKQALACIKLLQEVFLISRAEMKVNIDIQSADEQNFLNIGLTEKEKENLTIIKKPEFSSIELIIDPSRFKTLSELLKEKFKKSSIEVKEANISYQQGTDQGTVELEMRSNVLDQQEKQQQQQLQHQHQQQLNIDQAQNNKSNKNKSKKQDEQIILPQKQQQQQQQQNIQNNDDKKSKFKCSACLNVAFDSNQEFRQHYKSDWHIFNQKLKNQNQTPMSNEKYIDFILLQQMKI